MPAAKRASKKRRLLAPVSPPFVPKRTGYSPPDLCWDIILSNPNVASTLSSWRWMWTLPQVARAFALQRDLWVRWACACDAAPVIWKSKANALFALTARDMAKVGYSVVFAPGWSHHKEIHLMRRAPLLQLALDKHGGTCQGVNAKFLKRAAARERRWQKEQLRFG
jgi:hypothetical protein